MICRYRLYANGQTITFGDECLKNWDEISYAMKRSDYGGILHSFSSAFQFTGKACNLILGGYLSSYLDAKATISVFTINEDQSFNLLYKARLDYGSMKIQDGVLSINSFDDSITSMINSKKSTQFEYPVSELKESKKLNYDRLEMKNKVVYTVPPSGETTPSYPGEEIQEILDITMDDNGYYTLPLYVESSEIIRKNEIEVIDQMQSFYKGSAFISEYPCFFINKSDSYLTLNLHFKFSVFYNSTAEAPNDTFFIDSIVPGGLPALVYQYRLVKSTLTNVVEVDAVAVLAPGARLEMFFHSQYGKCAVRLSSISDVIISWNARADACGIDLIKPVTLLNRILSSINESSVGVTGEIESGVDYRLDNAMIMAAESVRGLDNAKIYTSYKKFADWMSVMFGYVPVIEKNVVRFVHRDSLYSDSEPSVIDGEINGFEFMVNDSIIYSRVKAGFEKKDYDSVNGRDEFHWTTEYDTGVNIKDNELELVSPYRADAYGIEFLALKRGEDTSDTGSDTDVFFVCAFEGSSQYTLNRSVPISGVFSPLTMYNVMYSPRSIITANRKYICNTIGSLVFASSDGNNDVTIDGTDEKDTYILGGSRLFTAGVVSLECTSGKKYAPESKLKIVKDGKSYIGYMNERSCKYGRYDGTKYELLIKAIE